MRLSVATTSVQGDLFAKLETIAETGFTGIELYEPDLTGVAGTATEIGKRAEALGLTVEVIQPFHDFEGLQGVARDQALARLDQKLDLMQALGARTLLVGTSTHPDATGDQDRISADLAELALRSGARGCRAALIALPWAWRIRTENAALRAVEAVDSPHLGLALSSFFSLADGSPPARLRDIPGDRLFHVQL